MNMESAGNPAAVSRSQPFRSELAPSEHAIARESREPDSFPDRQSQGPFDASWPVERWLLGRVLAVCGHPALHVQLWDGASLGVPPERAVGAITIRSRRTLWQLFLDPRTAFGDGYSDGSIEVAGSLVDVLSAMCEGWTRGAKSSAFARVLNRQHRRRSHSIAASRDSVHHHYDIGNEFYRLWLDEKMQYTCAYYADPHMTLEAAQLAKLDHVCRKLELKPGDRVIEAGCGWGSLALHMAQKYGASVKAYNLSREQLAYARENAQRQGVAQRVEFVEDDYRNATGPCDAFVSVGMLEHVGLENYGEMGRLLDRLLTPRGRGLIHSIGRNRPQPLDPWTDKHIFPGAYPPALSEMQQIFEPVGLSVLDIENLRLHYALTLEHWLERYERAAGEISKMFDHRFVRMWRMYLAASIATFKTGGLQLFQVVFARESNNDIPWTRKHLYT